MYARAAAVAAIAAVVVAAAAAAAAAAAITAIRRLPPFWTVTHPPGTINALIGVQMRRVATGTAEDF